MLVDRREIARRPKSSETASAISMPSCPKVDGYDHFSGICETNQAMIAMKTIVTIETINTTRPGMRLFDSVSAASARASGKRYPSESKRILLEWMLRCGVGCSCFSCQDGKKTTDGRS